MAKMGSAAVVVVLAMMVSLAAAWGNVGHEAVGAVAQALLSSSATSKVNQILGGSSLADVSTWADSIKHTSGYQWSAPLHYVDTEDKMCNFDYSRDCWDHELTPEAWPDACVAGAITNYTERATEAFRGVEPLFRRASRLSFDKVGRHRSHSTQVTTDDDAQSEALKFLVHFVGDIHQPLHVAFSGDRGGNEITVKFYGYKENLHAIWDEWIISRLLDDFYDQSQDKWVADLVNSIQSGNYSSDAAAWASCNDGSHKCTTQFASESIQYACQYAYECNAGSTPCDSMNVVDGSSLGDEYFQTTYPIVNLRIAQGGVRLAALLNHLYG